MEQRLTAHPRHSVEQANGVSEKEAALRMAIAEKDAQIATLTAANTKLEKAASGEGVFAFRPHFCMFLSNYRFQMF